MKYRFFYGTKPDIRNLRPGDFSGNDTILGKPVRVCEFMPDSIPGNKPIAFGDFSYYWVVLRAPFSLRTLTEKFVLHDQIGYLALEYLDGKLVRRDAVKVLQMTA